MNDANLIAHAEFFYSSTAQVLADGGDAIGLLDGELSDREVGRVSAYQRDIGAMQRGDEGELARFGGHLPRQQRRDRMWDGIVHVQQVEAVSLGHLRHARRQGQAVRRVLK